MDETRAEVLSGAVGRHVYVYDGWPPFLAILALDHHLPLRLAWHMLCCATAAV